MDHHRRLNQCLGCSLAVGSGDRGGFAGELRLVRKGWDWRVPEREGV
jgi:hypothetical protein